MFTTSHSSCKARSLGSVPYSLEGAHLTADFKLPRTGLGRQATNWPLAVTQRAQILKKETGEEAKTAVWNLSFDSAEKVRRPPALVFWQVPFRQKRRGGSCWVKPMFAGFPDTCCVSKQTSKVWASGRTDGRPREAHR